jgi:hypothetical protein
MYFVDINNFFKNPAFNVAAGFIPASKPARILMQAGINPATTSDNQQLNDDGGWRWDVPVSDFKDKSYWMTTRDYSPGEPLRKDIEVDVAIVGGGFTGLSSAYHIKKAEPNMRVALLESEVIGFGASGRNGGVNMTLFGLTMQITALRFSKAKAKEAHQYMERAVDYQDRIYDQPQKIL